MNSNGGPTMISTFAGCGGSSLGYKMAGYRVLAAVEFNHVAAETYRANFPSTPVLERDIRGLSAEELMGVAGVSRGELDVLDGSPPCQGFSTAGKREYADPRNDLAFEFVRLLGGLRPRAFVMENVSGLVKGKMKWIFAEITRALKRAGYEVRCKLLDAAWFGVPQCRKRLIWIGTDREYGISPLLPRPSMNRACPLREIIPDALGSRSMRINRWKSASEPSAAVTCAGIGGMIRDGNGIRNPTVAELKKLCSFPPDFELPAVKSHIYHLLGNSVPPLMMKAVAETIKTEILARCAN